MDPEETGLNSSNLKYLLIPYFKQLWFSGLTRTTQNNTKLRQPDYPTFVYLLYVFRIYSWMLQIERFSKLALYYLRVPSRSTTKLKHTGCTPQGSGLWVAVSFCSLFFISPDVANPTSRHPSDEGLLYSQCSNVIPISPVQKSVTHLHQLLVSRCQSFTSQPEVHADLQIPSNSFSLISGVPPYIWYSNSHIQIPCIHLQRASPGKLTVEL